MAELKINNIVVELGNKRLMFSKSGYSFSDWLTKEITYSERITLPETSVLNSIFKRPQNPDITGSKFSTFYSFVYSNFGKIVFSGIAQLLAFNENREYEIQLLDSSFELFVNQENDLNALPLDSYDFVFNTTNYNLLKVLSTDVWIWPVASFHETKTAAKIPPTTLAFSRPFFSVKRLVELMFSVNGWEYELSNESSSFDELIISAKSEFVFTSYEKLFNETLVISGSQLLDLAGYDFIKTDSISGTTILQLNYDSKIRFRGNVTADSDFKLQIIGSTLSGDLLTQEFFINEGSSFVDFTSELYETANPSYNLTFNFIGTGPLILEDLFLYTIIDENDFGAMSTAGFTDFLVKTYDNIPEIIQKELFKHCLVLIGGFFNTDNFRKKLNINSVVALSKLGSVDWSTKFIVGSEKITPLSNYGKTNYFNYDNSDIKPVNLGRGRFDIDNETIQDIKNVYNSIFESSPEVVIGGQNMIDNTIYDDTERINDIGTLIAYYEVVSTYTVARFAELNGNTILSTYYINFINAIKKGIIFEADFNLNKSDFFLFDFTKLVYIEYLKSTFYVLQIGDYSENSLTKLTLLKA